MKLFIRRPDAQAFPTRTRVSEKKNHKCDSLILRLMEIVIRHGRTDASAEAPNQLSY